MNLPCHPFSVVHIPRRKKCRESLGLLVPFSLGEPRSVMDIRGFMSEMTKSGLDPSSWKGKKNGENSSMDQIKWGKKFSLDFLTRILLAQLFCVPARSCASTRSSNNSHMTPLEYWDIVIVPRRVWTSAPHQERERRKVCSRIRAASNSAGGNETAEKRKDSRDKKNKRVRENTKERIRELGQLQLCL